MKFNLLKIVLFTLVCILLLLSKGSAQDVSNGRHVEVSLRMIGHQVLLSLGDSTSRVLPIVLNNNQYRIEFETEFEINPEELVSTINRVVKETKMANSYFLEVENCKNKEVVYSFEMNQLEQDSIIPCLSRKQPKSCYTLLFTLKEAATKQINTPAESSTESYIKTSLGFFSTIFMLIVLLFGVFFLRWKRRSKSTTKPNLISLGNYRFDTQKTELIIDHQKIELSRKEADLLLLLFHAINTTVERAVILNKVWGDEGAYVGRTLDVFISKLRKKLAADSNVKIINIRGVGYKLIIEE